MLEIVLLFWFNQYACFVQFIQQSVYKSFKMQAGKMSKILLHNFESHYWRNKRLRYLDEIPWIQNEIGHDVDITIQSIKQLYWKV